MNDPVESSNAHPPMPPSPTQSSPSPAGPGAGESAPPVPPAAPSTAGSGARRQEAPRRPWLVPALVVALLGLLVWQHVDLRLRLAATQDELGRRAAIDAAATTEHKTLIRQGLDSINAQQQKLTVLEARVADLGTQQAALEEIRQEFSRGREEWLLVEIEQLVGLAVHQIQLAGDIQAAIQALATADQRLARSQRPQFIGLRKAVAQDLQRLRSTTTVDVAGMAVRIENIANGVDAMPLAYDSRPAAAARGAAAKAAEPAVQEPWWQRGWREVWAEIRTLVRVERMDRPDPVVLAPNQLFFLRENLKLRLLSARVELLSRDQATFRSEVRLAVQWLEKHFDPRDKKVQGAIDILKPFLAAEFSIEPPSLAGSQAALRAVQLPIERAAR